MPRGPKCKNEDNNNFEKDKSGGVVLNGTRQAFMLTSIAIGECSKRLLSKNRALIAYKNVSCRICDMGLPDLPPPSVLPNGGRTEGSKTVAGKNWTFPISADLP